MKTISAIAALFVLSCMPALARQRISGWCEQGNQTILTLGYSSSTFTPVQLSYPSCTITVFITGSGGTKASLFSNNSGTALANPFTLGIPPETFGNGYWFFYVDNGRYDIQVSGQGVQTPFTLSDILANDPGAPGGTAYTTIQAGGSALPQRQIVNFINGGCVDNAGQARTDCTIPAGGGGGGGSGTVTSVGLQIVPTWLTATGSPITVAGTFQITAAPGQTSHQVIGTGGTTSFGPVTLGTADLPFTYTGNTTKLATSTGTLTSGHCASIDANGNLVDSGIVGCGGMGVTSVTFTGDGTVLSSTPSPPVTSTGTLTASLLNANAHTVLGNFTGSTGPPTYSAITTAMLPFTYSGPGLKLATTVGSLPNGHCVSIDASGNFVDSGQVGCGGGGGGGTVTSVGLAAPTGFVVSGSPVTAAGTLTFTMPSSWTTGDLLLGNGANSVARLGIGSVNQALLSTGTTAAWGAIGTVNLPFTYTGNTLKLVTSVGTLTSGHCVSIDANGNYVDSGVVGCGGGAGGVTSVFTRTGAVTAQTGDYTAAQVTNAVDVTQTYANPVWITSLAASKVGNATAQWNANLLQGFGISTTTPTAGQFFAWNAGTSSWTPTSVAPGSLLVQVAGANVGSRGALNFISGTGITQSCADNPGNSRVDCTPAVDTSVILTRTTDQANTDRSCTDPGASSTAYTCSLTPTLSVYTQNMTVVFTPGLTSGSSPTLNINALGPIALKKMSAGALVAIAASDLVAGTPYILRGVGSPVTGFVTVNEGVSSSVASGTTNTVAKYTSSTAIGNSSVFDDGTNPTQTPNGISVMINGGYDLQVANNAVTGTTLNKMACQDGAGKAIVCPTSTPGAVIGVCVQNCGTTGNAQICTGGRCSVIFDNTSVVNDWAILSTSVAGDLHDTGSTVETGGQQNVLVDGVNGGAGTAANVRFGGLDSFAVASKNVVTAANPATAANQVCVASGASRTCTYIDFPETKNVPFAICVNGTAATGVSTTTAVGGTCRAGTNNKDAFVGPFTTSDSSIFKVHLPKDWNTAVAPSLSIDLATTDATNGHTIILQASTECSKLDGTTTDDVAFNAAQSLGTVTINTTANQMWTATLASLTTTGCSAPGVMWIKITRTTDTATNVELYDAEVTIPRRIVMQAN